MKARRGDHEASFTYAWPGLCSGRIQEARLRGNRVTNRTNGRLWYRIEPTTGMPVFGLEGPMSFDEWEQVVDTALQDPRRRPGRILSDRRRMSGAPSTAFVEQIVHFFERRKDALGPTRWAVLTADHDAVYGMVRMAQVLAEPTPVEVEAFTQLGPAIAWLLDDVDDPSRERIAQWIERGAAVEAHGTRAAAAPPPYE